MFVYVYHSMLIFCSIIIGQTSFANNFWPLIMPQNIDIARVPPHLHFFSSLLNTSLQCRRFPPRSRTIRKLRNVVALKKRYPLLANKHAPDMIRPGKAVSAFCKQTSAHFRSQCVTCHFSAMYSWLTLYCLFACCPPPWRLSSFTRHTKKNI